MKIEELLASFSQKRILIVGDVMVDAYYIGKVTRISPEAPVPIIQLENQEERLGGAANVAFNVQSLGATPILCSVVGADDAGRRLIQLVSDLKLPTEGLIQSETRRTTIKTRIIGNNQHLLRVDAEDVFPISSAEEQLFIQRVQSLLEQQQIDAIILEDYNKGVLTVGVIEAIVALAKHAGIPTTVDPKKDNFFAYKGVTLFKPNLKELKEGVGLDFKFSEREKFDQAVAELETKLGNEISFVTLSEHGVFIKNKTTQHLVPAHIRSIADVSGAGDTVIAVATLCLACGCSIQTIAELANLAGGLVCEYSGVVSITPELLINEVENNEFN